MLRRFLFLAGLAGFFLPPPGGFASTQTLHVAVEGLRNDHGSVRCFLYNSEKGFPKDQSAAIAKVSGTISGGKSQCDFPNVVDGSYAISVYHDENGNDHLDANLLGIPKEGVGASNDAKAHMGPPKYKDAVLTINTAQHSIVIHIHYL